MAKYPNQQTLVIDKKQSTKYFASYGKPELAFACKVLHYSAFRVYIYLLSNTDGTSWDVSPSHAEREWGIPKSSFDDGRKELIKKGFIDKEGKIIHLTTNKEESEVRKTKRKTKKSDIRIYDKTNFGEKESEVHKSNKKINNNKLNKVCEVNFTNYEKPEEKGFVF